MRVHAGFDDLCRDRNPDGLGILACSRECGYHGTRESDCLSDRRAAVPQGKSRTGEKRQARRYHVASKLRARINGRWPKWTLYPHARQMRRAKKEQRRLRTYLGRVIRDTDRKLPEEHETKDE